VTLISSHAACPRADRPRGFAVPWRDGAPAGGFWRAAGQGSAEACQRRTRPEAQRVRIGARLAFAWRASCRGSGVPSGRTGGLAALGALADFVPEAEREHSQQGGASAELVSVFAIKRFGVVAGLSGRLVGFLSAGVAVAFAFPVHDRAFVPESVAVAEYAAAEHQGVIVGDRRRGWGAWAGALFGLGGGVVGGWGWVAG
jgi:hypothetical protein